MTAEPVDAVASDPLLEEIADLADLLDGVSTIVARRDRLIRKARAEGRSARQLVAASRLTEQRVYQILKELDRDAQPSP